MRLSLQVFFLAATVIVGGCSPYSRRGDRIRFTAKVLYTSDMFAGASLSGKTVVVPPALAASGPAASGPFSPERLAALLREARSDLRLSFGDAFEKRYCSSHDELSLSRFYASFFKGDVIAVQTSDSVWKAMEADYLLAVCVKFAAAIRSFDGNTRRRMRLEAELWDARAGEAVWRAEVDALDDVMKTPEDRFVTAALRKAFSLIPGGGPASDESDW